MNKFQFQPLLILGNILKSNPDPQPTTNLVIWFGCKKNMLFKIR